MPVKGTYLAVSGIGGILLWSGLKGKSWSSVLRNVISGQTPSSATSANSVAGINSGENTTGTQGTGSAPAGQSNYTQAEIETLWTSNGGPQDTAAFAAAVGMAESGGSATITSSNPDGGTNVGVFQLDTRGVGAGYSVQQLQNANLNARITIAATDGGTNWQEWGDPVTEAVGYHYTPGSTVP